MHTIILGTARLSGTALKLDTKLMVELGFEGQCTYFDEYREPVVLLPRCML